MFACRRRSSLGPLAALIGAASCGPLSTDPEAPDGARAPLPDEPAALDADIAPPELGGDADLRDPLLDAMAAENRRWADALADDDEEPAHYIAYQLTDHDRFALQAEGGALLQSDDERGRALDVEVRVGSPELDNRHALSDDRMEAFRRMPRLGRAPLQDDADALRRQLWLETDRRYRQAAMEYGHVRTQRRMRADEERSPDFSPEEPVTLIEAEAAFAPDRDAWRDRIRSCSRRALQGVATRARCRVTLQRTTDYFVNSEGSAIQQSGVMARMAVQVGTEADDGMPLSRTEERFAATPEELADDGAIAEMIETASGDLEALSEAPAAEPFAGPAILDGRAAAVFMHEVFGHRVEAHRQEHREDGQTFADSVGELIMPSWMSVYDDPRMARMGDVPLAGHYPADDEGVPAQRVDLVEDGVLSGFVQGRQPLEGFPSSTGHGRREVGHLPVSRQGNLAVEASRSLPREELMERLTAEIERQDAPYGLVVTEIAGGMTNTHRLGPQAFQVSPVMAYRVYPDGRRELVRGVDIVGTPLAALASIRAAGRPVETFNGLCGAESGWVPVSASSPSLLFESLEVERSYEPEHRPPVLSPPGS